MFGAHGHLLPAGDGQAITRSLFNHAADFVETWAIFPAQFEAKVWVTKPLQSIWKTWGVDSDSVGAPSHLVDPFNEIVMISD